MLNRIHILFVSFFLFSLVAFDFYINTSHSQPSLSSSHALVKNFGSIPVRFEENRGQFPEHIKFAMKSSRYTAFVTDKGLMVANQRFKKKPIYIEFVGAADQLTQGTDMVAGKVNYFYGNDESKWIKDIPLYKEVRAKSVYSNIDVRYYKKGDLLEYDFIVQPGGDLNDILLDVKNADSLKINRTGSLEMKSGNQKLLQHKPIIYQMINNQKVMVDGNYEFMANDIVRFKTKKYDKSKPLIIDPVLELSTLIGGEDYEMITDVEVDSTGIYLTGNTNSIYFPTTNPLQPNNAGGAYDAFVTKLSPDGSSIIYSTYLGGSGYDGTGKFLNVDDDTPSPGIAVSSAGEVYLAGTTGSSNDFPLMNAYQSTFGSGANNPNGTTDGFVTKLNSAGNALVFSTFIGGDGYDYLYDVALDSADNPVVVGATIPETVGFPTTTGVIQETKPSGGYDHEGVIAKFSTTGSLLFSTYLGGNNQDHLFGVELDAQNNIYVVGKTNSTSILPILNAPQANRAGNYDLYIAKLNDTATTLNFGTYWGGSNKDIGRGIALDSTGKIIVVGDTSSSNFPTQSPYQSARSGSRDAVVVKMSDAGVVDFSTFLGNTSLEYGWKVGTDNQDRIYVSGMTRSNNFPTVSPITEFNTNNTSSGGDAFITQFSADGSNVAFSSKLGGDDVEHGLALYVTPLADIYIAGITKSSNFYTTPGALQSAPYGFDDAFLIKLVSDNPVGVAPDISVTSPANGTITNDSTPAIALSFTDNGSGVDINTVEVTVDSVLIAATCTGDSVSATCTPDSPINDGSVTIAVSVEDTTGLRSTSDQVTIVIDTTSPVVTITNPVDGSFTNQTTYTVDGSINEATQSLTVNGVTVTPDASNNFTHNVTLTEGANTVTVIASDLAGNQSTEIISVTLDTQPPSPANGSSISVGAPNNGIVIITGAAGSVEANSNITITNVRTGQSVVIVADVDGAFISNIAGEPGDVYTIVVSDQADNSSTSIVVEQENLPPDPSTVATELSSTELTPFNDSIDFLYTGNNPVQTGVDVNAMDADRVTVIRGKVMSADGLALPGVTISIKGRSEFGQTLSRSDGMFDIVVNGGGLETIEYKLDGHLPVQRQLKTQWLEFGRVEDVVMTELDTQMTIIDLTLNNTSIAQGSIVSDNDGSRQATVIFPAGTNASMTMPDGTQQSISTLSFRATEYTQGALGRERMPGVLPATSAYTYAVDLSVDEAISAGATNVTFDQPLPFYVDNFIGFPIGEVVPVGYYDYEQASWLPSENGRVIEILSVDANGLAQLDIDGSGLAADSQALADLQVTPDEQTQLGLLYNTGDTIWRSLITHFTPYDCNWPYGPPEDSEPPPEDEPITDENPEEEIDCEGCIINSLSQTLQEEYNITGTPYFLNYSSNLKKGRSKTRQIEIKLSDSDIPLSLKSIELEVEVAGQLFTESFTPASNLTYIYTWDGLDAYGREVVGNAKANIKIGYKYTAVYLGADGILSAFLEASRSGAVLTGIRELNTVVLTRNWSKTLLSPITPLVESVALGGWSLDVHHAYDPNVGILYKGDGSIRNDNAFGPVLDTYIDNSIITGNLVDPTSVEVGPDGSIYVSERTKIKKLSADGIFTTIAGTGGFGATGDGGLATNAELGVIDDIDLAPDGSIYLADINNRKIRKIDTAGIITTVAGNGSITYSGDGGPAINAGFAGLYGIDVDSDGSIYIAGLNRIRKITPDGVIRTIAGDGTSNPFVEGQASLASISSLRDIELGANASLYVSDRYRVFEISQDGLIKVVAGTDAVIPNNGDGNLATDAKLNEPIGMALGPDGTLYIAESGESRIRSVMADGIINTFAGGSTSIISGDGGPAVLGGFYYAKDVAIGPNGHLYVVDRHAVRVIRPSSFSNVSSIILGLISEDGSELFTFNAQGRHQKTIDVVTGVDKLLFGYDPDGRLISITDVDGDVTNIQRDSNGIPISITSPDLHTTNLTLNSNGYLSEISNPNNEIYEFEYTNDGLLTKITTPLLHTTDFGYDASGLLINDINNAGGGWTINRNNLGDNSHQVVMTTGEGRNYQFKFERTTTNDQIYTNIKPSGLVDTALYKFNGEEELNLGNGLNITRTKSADERFGIAYPVIDSQVITTPAGLVSTYSESRQVTLDDPDNLLSHNSIVNTFVLNGNTTTSSYDSLSRTWTIVSPEGRSSTLMLNNLARLSSLELPGLETVTLAYTSDGQLDTMSTGQATEQRLTDMDYYQSGASKGYVSSVINAENKQTQFEYDLAGRISKLIYHDSRELIYDYDANGNLDELTTAKGHIHEFAYNEKDQLEKYTAPSVAGINNTITTYTYNLDNQIDLITLPSSETIDYQYDSLTAQLASLIIPRGTYSLLYDTVTQQVDQITAPDGGVLSFDFDGPLLTNETWTGDVVGNVDHVYSNDFLLSQRSVNGGSQISFSYDDDLFLISAGDLTVNRKVISGLIDDTVISTSGNSITTDHSYNQFGEIDTYSADYNTTQLFDVSYTRDKLGRITQKIETIDGANTTTSYVYDDSGRLDQVIQGGVIVSDYQYDDNNNRTHEVGILVATHDEQDRLISYKDNNYTYNDDGQLSTKTHQPSSDITTYNYDNLGNLISVNLPNSTSVEYVIDGRNRRVGKKVNGTLTKSFLYADQLNPIAELDGLGNILSRFVYADKSNVPAYMIKNSDTYRIISDHLGSPRLIVKVSDGTVTQRIDYDEWGNITNDTNPGFQPFGFAGGLYDQDTKLIRYGARDYDPEVGRWTSKDPILFNGGSINLYSYSINDPINYFDFNGEIAVNVIGAVTGAIVGGVGAALTDGSNAGSIVAGALIGAATGAVTGGPLVRALAEGVANALNQAANSGPCEGVNISEVLAASAFGSFGTRDFIPVQPNLASNNLTGQIATEAVATATAQTINSAGTNVVGNF